MINGIKNIWIIFDMNNHKTNAGYGSKRNILGASIFQPSQHIVQNRIKKKKLIVPTALVLQPANRSDLFRRLL